MSLIATEQSVAALRGLVPKANKLALEEQSTFSVAKIGIEFSTRHVKDSRASGEKNTLSLVRDCIATLSRKVCKLKN